MRSYTAGVLVAVLLAQIVFCRWFLLLQSGDVETNPGPDPKPSVPAKSGNLRQSRLRSATEGSSERRESVDASATSSIDITLNEILEKLASMDSKFESKLDALREEMTTAYNKVGAEVQGLREEVEELRSENTSLRAENHDLRQRMDNVDAKLDDLECRSRRNNLLFHGLPRPPNESPEECEQTVREFLTDSLEMAGDMQFDRVHRTSDKANAPVIARCTVYKDKTAIMKAKSKLRGKDSRVFIGEDFSARVRQIRKQLTPHLKDARNAGKRAVMVFDHLLIDGKRFVLTADGRGIREVQYQAQGR